ncbi:S-layer homology domain-containing protein [Paenibacillus sp. V4I7]|uniref:S-layer homology domain-containing protein n=1 Tax=Paenibacillus sp. V4I7 TaxID=3042307 RepID=UPI00278A8BC1|nr:S-layer homology domain-containing protein [Paenibacillus sp. V4I7]MDQ0898508.1 hypothetical protein [Paenibacillus sp. V4I7]
MNKKIALFLSFLLLCYCLAPLAYAEDTASQTSQTTVAPSTSATSSETSSTTTKATTPSSSVTSDTYLADQFGDLKSVSKDDKKKINALLKMEVIDTASVDSFGLDQEITRAQLAKTVAIVLGLRIDKMVTASSFSDVKSDDPARLYIEALKNSALSYDVVDKFNPTGQVTRQELAMLLIKGLGLDEKAKAVTPSKDDSVDNTYKSYVAYALQQKIMTNQVNGKFGGNVSVTRKAFALAVYAAMQLHLTTAKPEKASIAEVKLIGTGKLSVRLNREVDTNSAILAVTKYGSDTALSSSTEWSDDSMTAIVETDALTYGKYTIELSGLDAGSIDKGKIEIISEVGKIQKLEIVTSTEKLPKSKAIIAFKATNQYGETIDISASDLNITVGAQNRKVDFYPKEQAFIIDLSNEFIGSTVMVSLLETRSFQSASKTFIIDDFPVVTKLELGDDLMYPGGNTIFKAGVRAYLVLKAYDQHGNPIVDSKILNMGIQKAFTGTWGNVINNSGQNDFIDFDNDGYPELQLEANRDMDGNQEVTMDLFFAGQQVSKKINVIALKKPATIAIKPLTEPAAEGDGEKFFGLTIKDSTGYEFSSAEIVEAETTGRISVYATGGIVLEADTLTRKDPVTGTERKVAIRSTDGQIRVKEVKAAGPATINVRLNALNQTVTMPIHIEKPRKPNSIKLDADSSESVTMFPGVTPTVKFIINDQYDILYRTKRGDYKVEMKLEKISGDSGALTGTSGGVVLNDLNPVELRDLDQISNQSINLVPHATLKGSYRLTATLVQVDPSGQIQESLQSLSVEVDVIDQYKVDLTYEIDPGSTSLLATGRMLYDSGITKSVTDATYLFTNYSSFQKDLNINVKDSSGYKVSLSAPIKAVTFSRPNVIGYRNGKMIGLDSGKATATVYLDTPFGMKKVTAEIGVTADPMSVSEIKFASNGPKEISSATLNGLYVWNANLLGRLQAVTNYATFTNQPSNSSPTGNQDQITPYNDILNVQVFISDIVYTEPVASKRDTISVGSDFKISYTPKGATSNIKQFTIHAVGGTQLKSFIVAVK